MRTATVWIENGVFALLFRPYQGAFGGSNVPAPRNLLNQGKNNANARGGGGGGGCISWKHSVPRELVVPVFSKISRGSTFYAGLFASITSAEFKTKFYFETKPYESSADKENKKLLNFPPFWEKVFLTPAVPLSYQKHC